MLQMLTDLTKLTWLHLYSRLSSTKWRVHVHKFLRLDDRYRIVDRKLLDIYIVQNNILMMNMWSVESFEVLMKYSHPPHVPGYGYCWDEGRAVPALGTQNIMFHSKCGLEASCVTPRLNISAGHWGTEIQNISLSLQYLQKIQKPSEQIFSICSTVGVLYFI